MKGSYKGSTRGWESESLKVCALELMPRESIRDSAVRVFVLLSCGLSSHAKV